MRIKYCNNKPQNLAALPLPPARPAQCCFCLCRNHSVVASELPRECYRSRKARGRGLPPDWRYSHPAQGQTEKPRGRGAGALPHAARRLASAGFSGADGNAGLANAHLCCRARPAPTAAQALDRAPRTTGDPVARIP